jgi:hypothetical protein
MLTRSNPKHHPVEETLPLLFLAASACPEEQLRKQIAWRLDDAIIEGNPLHSDAEVRNFFAHHTSRASPFRLDDAVVEMAVRLVRLSFSERTNSYPFRADGISGKCRPQWVRILGASTFDPSRELVVTSDLEALDLKRFSPELRRQHSTGQPLPHASHLMVRAIGSRLEKLRVPGPSVWASCQAKDGFRLMIDGELPWRPCSGPERLADSLQWASCTGTGATLEALGVTVTCTPENVILQTTNPESIIRFAAALARGESITLQRQITPGPEGRVILLLRDFEGDIAEMPCLASYQPVEDWLHAPAIPPIELSREEKAAIARWLYPPDCWLNTELVEDLFCEDPASTDHELLLTCV